MKYKTKQQRIRKFFLFPKMFWTRDENNDEALFWINIDSKHEIPLFSE